MNSAKKSFLSKRGRLQLLIDSQAIWVNYLMRKIRQDAYEARRNSIRYGIAANRLSKLLSIHAKFVEENIF